MAKNKMAAMMLHFMLGTVQYLVLMMALRMVLMKVRCLDCCFLLTATLTSKMGEKQMFPMKVMKMVPDMWKDEIG